MEIELQDTDAVSNAGSPATTCILGESGIQTPKDLLKPYYFGCGPVHPKWLQFFADKKFFTLLACCFTFLHSSVISGYISVILSTIQIRYQFSSLAAGFIVIAYDLSVAIGITVVTYFASYFHKPRVLGIGCILLGFTALLFASPQFLFGTYDSSSVSVNILDEVCLNNRTMTSDGCSSSGNSGALSIFIISSILLSLSSSVLYTLTDVHIDELVVSRFVSLHIGVFNVFMVLGPAAGFLIGSACLSIYVDPWMETTLTTSDPAWVGAWWIPFVFVGILSFILAIPFLMYPKWLKDSHLIYEQRQKQMTMVYDHVEEVDGNKAVFVVKQFFIQMKRLMCNVPFMFTSFGLAISYIYSQGVISFAPQYLENQFYLSASTAGIVTGLVAIPATITGVLTGASLLYIFKWDARQNILVVTLTSFISLPFLLALFFHCPTVSLAGVTTEYSNGSQAGIDVSVCASACNCVSTVFEPVCGSDNITYFSACRAGCINADMKVDNDFENCSCLSDEVYTATSGLCNSTCLMIVPALILFILSIAFGTIIFIPYQYFMLRVVADDQRALALGLQSTIWRIFGAVPGPLLFGGLFDLSCAVWQEECGRRGNCWLWHDDKLSNYAMSVGFPCVFVGGCFFLIAFLTFPKKEKQELSDVNKTSE